jgi:hypothetical protein
MSIVSALLAIWLAASAPQPVHTATRHASRSASAGSVQDSAKPAEGRVLRIERGDGITRHHLAALQQRSVTARDLLDRVERLPDTILIVRAYPLLVRTTGVYGRGLFWVNGQRLFGYLRYQTESLGNDRPLCILIHELAHAVEMAGVDRGSGTAGLRQFVLSRAVGEDPLNWRGAETEFPPAVAHRVWLELLGRIKGPSGLEALAAERNVRLPTWTFKRPEQSQQRFRPSEQLGKEGSWNRRAATPAARTSTPPSSVP